MTASIPTTATRTNHAHAAMWAVGFVLLLGGAALTVTGVLTLQGVNTSLDAITKGSIALYLGGGVSSLGLLLVVIAWTIAAARR